MRCWRRPTTILIIAIAAAGVQADELPGRALDIPHITAQGFSIDTALVGEARSFDSVRVRVEAPSRIAKLVISTGERDIDLANTKDRSMFAMFDLGQRPLHAYDVTLDIAPFINSHFTAPATYRLTVTVTDRAGAIATAALTATVVSDKQSQIGTADTGPIPQQLQESAMTLTRQATLSVEPVERSPLVWITREAVNVTIRLRPADPDAKIHQLDLQSWDQTLTSDSLEKQISASRPVPYVDIPTARNAAADTVLAISGESGNALIHITASATSLSQLGTTVTLAALIRD